MKTSKSPFLYLEFLLLCAVLPTVIIYFRLAPFMFAFLWGAAGYCYVVYRKAFGQTWAQTWNWQAVTWGSMRPLLARWIVCCALMTVFIYFYDPQNMLYMAKMSPSFMVVLLCLYPLLSAFPQEFIFCTFFFKRYEPFFGQGQMRVIASMIVFTYAHILFLNWVAPVLSLIAGYIFARTYHQYKSLALVTIEHGLYGNYLFFIGLGWYFYGGAVTP